MCGEELIALSTAVFNRYYSREKELRDDLISEGILAMLNNESKFDGCGSKKMTTYMWISARNGMAKFIRKENKQREHIIPHDLSNIEQFVFYIEDEIEKNGYRECLEKVRQVGLDVKGAKRRNIVNDILNGESQSDIGRKYGVKRQRVNEVFRRVKKRATDIYRYVDGGLVEKENFDVQGEGE